MGLEKTGATIMIVDDEPENLRVLGAMIGKQGYTARSFPSGTTALKSARAETPDLIMLDILMPDMDGFEVCARLKASDRLKDIPVLFLSAADESSRKIRAFELGGADYITKPFQAEEVLARINTHLTASRHKKNIERLNKELETRVHERTTDLRETNKSLQLSEEKYRSIVTTANEGILTTDETFRIVYANEKLADLLGGTRDQIIGQPALAFILDEDQSEIQHRFQERQTGKQAVYECRLRRFDGAPCWVMVSASPVLDSNGNFKQSVVMLTDISDRKQSEIKLKTALAEIVQLKSQIEADKIYLQEEIKLEHNFEEIIGNSNEIKYVLFRIEQVAQTNATVLVLGETGTGKELFARAIHSAGSLSRRPLIKVNCAAFTESLIESELFGHVKGAFSGAVKSRQGRFELANNGTLFLDEIGDFPLQLQSKLLRVLETGEFERVGDSRTVKSDVRIIAATNRDLEELVRKGIFREDLWYRLNVFPITIPPLRNRKEDIPLLVDHFVRKFSRKMGRKDPKVTKDVMNQLTNYGWPGNIRELKHMIERSIITSPGNKLRLRDKLTEDRTRNTDDDLTKPLAAVEAEHISRVLEYTHWVIEGPDGAANILQLHPNTLRYRMKKLNIQRPAKHQDR